MYKVQFPELPGYVHMYNVQSTKYNLSSVDRGLNHYLFEKVELINKFAN